VTLPAFAADLTAVLLGASAYRAAIDRHRLPAGRSAANPLHAAAVFE